MNRLLLFSIGSVQEYIMESKKVIDLTNSSAMISSIMNGVKTIIEEDFGGTIILPYGEVCENIQTSNQLLIIYDAEKSKAYEIEKKVKNQFKACIQKLMKNDKNVQNLKEEMDEELEELIESYWVEVELKEKDYEEAYKKAYYSLEAIKNTRVFQNEEEKEKLKGRKCSICGKRNIRFYKKINRKKDLHENAVEIQSSQLKEKEGLCIPCYIKRCLPQDEEKIQNSTAKIALGRWIEENENKDYYKELEKIATEKAKESKHGKYQLLYKENSLKEISPEKKEEIENYYETLTKKQEKYYCIYRFDIDNLGKWMSGEYKEDKNQSLQEYQQELSMKIHGFFKKSIAFFEKNKNNTLVYTGGDDLLGLFNVEDSFRFSREIEKEFKRIFQSKENEKFKKLTFSQGLFIIHYKDTLKESLKITKERLEAIKESFGSMHHKQEKNGLIIAVLTDGYEYKEFYFKNHINRKYIIDSLINIFNCFHDNKFTFFHNELAKMFISLDEYEELEEKRTIRDMIFVQQKRLIRRSNKKEKQEGQNNKVEREIKKLQKRLEEIFYANTFDQGTVGLKNYFNMLYIMEKIHIILKEDDQNE